MKTFIAIALTAAITWFVSSAVHGIQTATDHFWLVSAIKAPGRMAINDIETDMNAGRYQLAKAKIDALADTWHRFETGPDQFRGPGISDVMVTFSNIDTNNIAKKIHP